MAQKVSKKLTRAQKQAISMERWAIIRELSELQEEVKTAIKEAMSTQSTARELRRQLKDVKATVTDIRSYVKARFNINLVKKAYETPSIRIPTPLDEYFNRGLATSIWANIKAAPEGEAFWLEIISTIVNFGRKDMIFNIWDGYYFSDYEDFDGTWNTDYIEGYDCLKEFLAIYNAIAEKVGKKPYESAGV